MRRVSYFVAVGIVVWVLGFSFKVEAGSKDLEAQKRNKFEDDTVVSAQESMDRQQEEESVFRKELLESSRETVRLLKEIKGVLEEMKETAEEAAAAKEAAEVPVE